MSRAHRILAFALLVSLALHLLMLASAGSWWSAPAREIPFPIEAHLTLPKPAPPPPVATAAKTIKSAPATAVDTPTSTHQPPEPIAAPVVAPIAASVMLPVVAAADTPPPAVPAQVAPATAPEPALPPALRTLPETLTLRYAVQAGEGGFNLGQAIYTWQQRDGRYSLVSIAQATGLASLFVSGKLVQTSEGSLTARGLQPEQYWLARNERKQDTARFEWSQGRLLQGGGSVDLQAGSQDVLSFPFHLAMTVDESTREWVVWVSNGRKLRDYLFHNLGHERLALREIEIDTLHLQGSRSGEGTLDVWLAPSRHWLPLRIRTLDQKGKVLVLTLEE